MFPKVGTGNGTTRWALLDILHLLYYAPCHLSQSTRSSLTSTYSFIFIAFHVYLFASMSTYICLPKCLEYVNPYSILLYIKTCFMPNKVSLVLASFKTRSLLLSGLRDIFYIGDSGSGPDASMSQGDDLPATTAGVAPEDDKLPLAALRVPAFTEPTDSFSARMFIDKINYFTATFNWTDKQAVNAALNALQGKARTWYESTIDTDSKAFETYTKFQEAFLQRFKPSRNIAAQVKTLHSLYQKQSESVRDFYERVDVTFSLIFRDVMPAAANPKKGVIQIRGHIVILEFINGLRPDIKAIVEAQTDVSDGSLDHKNKVDDLLMIAERAESSQADKSAAVEEVASNNLEVVRPNFAQRGRGRGLYERRGYISGLRGRAFLRQNTQACQGSGFRPPAQQIVA